jgi:hypothetical protein
VPEGYAASQPPLIQADFRQPIFSADFRAATPAVRYDIGALRRQPDATPLLRQRC